jgi:hypothetical protein
MSLVPVSTKAPRSVAKRSKPASKCVANGAVRHYWLGPIAAAYAKNRRQDVLPLRANTATALAVHLAGKMPTAAAFARPPKENVIDAFRADLDAAGVAYVDASRFANFHALRHMFIANLAAGGVHPKTAQHWPGTYDVATMAETACHQPAQFDATWRNQYGDQ